MTLVVALVLIGVLVAAVPWLPVTPDAASAEPDSAVSEQQLEGLVREYGALLYRVAFAVTGERALAEDVVQDALVAAWTSLPSLDGDDPVRWLRTVTKNRAISVMRREARSSATVVWDRLASTEPAVDQIVESRARLAATQAALAELDDASRLLIVLREAEGLTYVEIGELMGLSESAVKARLYRARFALRERLESWDL